MLFFAFFDRGGGKVCAMTTTIKITKFGGACSHIKGAMYKITLIWDRWVQLLFCGL